jgi:C1A family cysteine protease
MGNYHKVQKFNAQSDSAKLALNKFADLTGAEFKQKYSNCAYYSEPIVAPLPHQHVEVPASVDWRTKGVVTPIKNQGQCGSCWTFSTTGTLEGFHAINTGKLLSFSEQQIVDCASSAGSGCGGGWPYLALEYTASEGLEQESEYPYTAEDGTCAYNAQLVTKTNAGYTLIATKSVNALETSIVNMPTSILIEADQDVFQLYSSGVITSGCGATLDHAVLAVGYNSDSFIVKNSWGADWGDEGYVYIGNSGSANSGDGVCGILSQPVVPK